MARACVLAALVAAVPASIAGATPVRQRRLTINAIPSRNPVLAGKGLTMSPKLVEHVSTLVSLTASSTTTDTMHPIVFSGQVVPDHAAGRVILQELLGSGTWKDLKSTVLGSASTYALSFHWRFPGEHDVRVVFSAGDRNIASASNLLSVTIQQEQVRGFTIASSSTVISYGQSAAISGVLDRPGANAPEPETNVTLWARNMTQSQASPVGEARTDSDGRYSFPPVAAVYNTIYQVRITRSPDRRSAKLFEGVADVLTLTRSASASTVGGTVAFIGTVLPDKVGEVLALQVLEPDGQWQTLEDGRIQAGSTFGIRWRFASAGVFTFRVHIISDEVNVDGASAAVRIRVAAATSAPRDSWS